MVRTYVCYATSNGSNASECVLVRVLEKYSTNAHDHDPVDYIGDDDPAAAGPL